MPNEAMGLASMNPIPGNNRGAILVNTYNDKDLSNWGNYRIMRDLTNKYGIEVNDNGKLDLVENTDLDNKYISVYIIKNPNTDNIFNEILKEIELNIQERPIRPKSYLYEIFTEHQLYSSDQLDYDIFLEKIELDKLSKSLSSDVNLGRHEKKNVDYSLGNSSREFGNQIEDNESFSLLMAHAELEDF